MLKTGKKSQDKNTLKTGKLQSWETALEAAHDALERNKSRAARLRAAIRLFSEKIANKEPWPLQR